jgi:acyl-CoA hydrolase
MMRALSAREDWEDVTVSGGLILGNWPFFTHPGVHYRGSFYGGGERWAKAQGGDVQFVPSFFRQYNLLIQHLAPRVMMCAGALPDAQGNVSVSLHNGAHLEELRRCGQDPTRLLIVEVSPHYPRTYALPGHHNSIPLAEIDVLVTTDEHPPVFPNDPGTEADAVIASYAASYVKDGATLQTGIGAVPNLVAQALATGDGGDYGVHSEMFTDGLLALSKAGKVTNAAKTIHPGYSVITFAAGSPEMYEFLHENTTIGMAPVHYTNDPHVIRQNHRMVSINSALEVDLQGQIVADTIGARQYTGVGGHQDFTEGTSFDLSHVSLICLQSTAVVNGERKSRISARPPVNGVVTTPRQLTGVVITEFGAADVRGLTVAERAQALIDIAHPDFRDELRISARELGR